MSDEIKESPEFYITAVRAGPVENSGELLIDYQLTKEFKTWYKEKNNLKRWSRKRFEKDLATMVNKQMAIDSGYFTEEINPAEEEPEEKEVPLDAFDG